MAAAVALLTEATTEPQGISVWTIAQQVAVFLVTLATLYGLVLRPIIRKLTQHWRDAVAQIASQQQQLQQQVAEVSHQVHPNSGRSAHDYARKGYEMATRAFEVSLETQGRVTAMGAAVAETRLVAQETQRALEDHLVDARAEREADTEALADQGITLPEPTH